MNLLFEPPCMAIGQTLDVKYSRNTAHWPVKIWLSVFLIKTYLYAKYGEKPGRTAWYGPLSVVIAIVINFMIAFDKNEILLAVPILLHQFILHILAFFAQIFLFLRISANYCYESVQYTYLHFCLKFHRNSSIPSWDIFKLKSFLYFCTVLYIHSRMALASPKS